jgi:uncharacterized protein
MIRSSKIQYFETEGRENLSAVIKCVKTFLRGLETQGAPAPRKIVFLTVEGEGPMMAYNQLQSHDLRIIAVTFPIGSSQIVDDKLYKPQVSSKVRDFFNGVKIPIVTSRLPFEEIVGADAHNREMKIIREALGLFGSSMALAVQAVLQATDAGYVEIGEQVIAATGDTAILVTATTTYNVLRQDRFGFAVNEILCKPRSFTVSRKLPSPPKTLEFTGGNHIEAETDKSKI